MPMGIDAARLADAWTTAERWRGITRPYSAADVLRLRGTVNVEYSLAQQGADRLCRMLREGPYLPVLSAVTGNQAVEEVRAGLQGIYVSGWQVAADANTAGETYPDQSLYPSDSVPTLVRRLNNALRRADQVHHLRGDDGTHWMVPLVADAEAGFGGSLHAFELMRGMIEAGAAGVHFEDQLSAVKKCGHLGGKVLVPTAEFVAKLVAARLAADVCGVDTLLIARTDALSATLLTSDHDTADRPFVNGGRTPEGFYEVTGGIDAAIARALSYAPYADLLWFETSHPDMAEARRFAAAIHERFPDKWLAYNCSPSFNWRRHLSPNQIATFKRELGVLGYRFQFVTLSGFHALNHATFELARGYRERGMAAYAELQSREFGAATDGYEAVRHQEFVGTGYFDAITEVVSGGASSTVAMRGSTEQEQFRSASVA